MSYRLHWTVWVLLGVFTGLLLTGWPSSGHPVPGPDLTHEVQQAVRKHSRVEHQQATVVYTAEPQQQLLYDMESITDLVPEEYRALCAEISRANGLEPRVLAALGWVESRWDPDAVGTSGEVGITQVMPTTGAWVAHKLNLYDYDLRDPRTNLTLGATYLRWLIAEHGSVDRALMAYNAGPQFETRAPVAARGYADRIRLAMTTKTGEGVARNGNR